MEPKWKDYAVNSVAMIEYPRIGRIVAEDRRGCQAAKGSIISTMKRHDKIFSTSMVNLAERMYESVHEDANKFYNLLSNDYWVLRAGKKRENPNMDQITQFRPLFVAFPVICEVMRLDAALSQTTSLSEITSNKPELFQLAMGANLWAAIHDGLDRSVEIGEIMENAIRHTDPGKVIPNDRVNAVNAYHPRVSRQTGRPC
jgi:hypothetical protein